MTSSSPQMPSDLTLQQLLAQADAEQKTVPLTLYMPWGIASGNSAGRSDFYAYSADFLRRSHLSGIFEQDQGRAPDDDYVHLTQVKCYSAMTVQQHEVLRLRAADVTAWVIGLPTDPDISLPRLPPIPRL
jgi:hypothetical protein